MSDSTAEARNSPAVTGRLCVNAWVNECPPSWPKKIVPTTATPSAPPSCCAVLNSPEAPPAAWLGTAASTTFASGMTSRLSPAPARTRPGTTGHGSEPVPTCPAPSWTAPIPAASSSARLPCGGRTGLNPAGGRRRRTSATWAIWAAPCPRTAASISSQCRAMTTDAIQPRAGFRSDSPAPAAHPVVVDVDLVGAADAAEPAGAVARGVDERDGATLPLAAAEPAAPSLGDQVGEPRRGERLDPGGEVAGQRPVVQVVGQPVVRDQPGTAVRFDQEVVDQLGPLRLGQGLEHGPQSRGPVPQIRQLGLARHGLLYVEPGQQGPDRRHVGYRVVHQRGGDVRAGRRVSVELHKGITSCWSGGWTGDRDEGAAGRHRRRPDRRVPVGLAPVATRSLVSELAP